MPVGTACNPPLEVAWDEAQVGHGRLQGAVVTAHDAISLPQRCAMMPRCHSLGKVTDDGLTPCIGIVGRFLQDTDAPVIVGAVSVSTASSTSAM